MHLQFFSFPVIDFFHLRLNPNSLKIYLFNRVGQLEARRRWGEGSSGLKPCSGLVDNFTAFNNLVWLDNPLIFS